MRSRGGDNFGALRICFALFVVFPTRTVRGRRSRVSLRFVGVSLALIPPSIIITFPRVK